MKQFYSLILLVLLSITTQAQTETYEFSIEYVGIANGNHQVALIFTPDDNVTAQLSSDFGAMISVPTGYTVGTITAGNSGIPASEILVDDYGISDDNGNPTFYINRLPPTSNINFNFTSGTPITIANFEVMGATLPTSGAATLLPPGDSSRLGFLEDFVNMGVDNRYCCQSTSDFEIDFATLGTVTNELEGVSIYPNPVNNVLNIKGLNNELQKVSVFNVGGQQVISQTTGLETINTSALSAGIYFVKLETENSTKTIKIVKE